MTLTVEDGTGLANSNSYGTLANATTYFADRANTTWDEADDDLKTAALIRATDYIEARFGQRFLGTKLVTTQALSFPRQGLYDREGTLVEGLPSKVKQATYEYALRALSGDLWNEPLMNPKGRLVVERTKIGPIEEDIRYVFNEGISKIKPVPAADNLLSEYLFPAGNTVIR